MGNKILIVQTSTLQGRVSIVRIQNQNVRLSSQINTVWPLQTKY